MTRKLTFHHVGAVLGVKLVVVLGAREGIDRTVRAAGREVRYVGGQRVTDEATMQAAVQAAGAARMQFEARLSKVSTACCLVFLLACTQLHSVKRRFLTREEGAFSTDMIHRCYTQLEHSQGSTVQGPAVPMVRRHMNSSAARFGPQVQTVSGNYVAAKRKGVVNGVDLGYTGMVRSVVVVCFGISRDLKSESCGQAHVCMDCTIIRLNYQFAGLQVRSIEVHSVNRQLDAGYMVLLSNLGYSASGAWIQCCAILCCLAPYSLLFQRH